MLYYYLRLFGDLTYSIKMVRQYKMKKYKIELTNLKSKKSKKKKGGLSWL